MRKAIPYLLNGKKILSEGKKKSNSFTHCSEAREAKISEEKSFLSLPRTEISR